MSRDLRCHLGDTGHGARATGDETPSSPWSLGMMNKEGREAILREISLKQLRWLDWHTRDDCVLHCTFDNCNRGPWKT